MNGKPSGQLRFPRPAPRRRDEDGVLPLINIVFLLLIFFMLAGRLAAPDPFEVAPPDSASEGHLAIEDVVVLVAADGRLALDGVEMPAEALQRAVAARVRAVPAVPVRLRADAAAEAIRVVGVMEDLRAAGVERLELLTVAEAP